MRKRRRVGSLGSPITHPPSNQHSVIPTAQLSTDPSESHHSAVPPIQLPTTINTATQLSTDQSPIRHQPQTGSPETQYSTVTPVQSPNTATQHYGVPLAQPPTTILSTTQHSTVLSTTHQPLAGSPETQHSTATPVRSPNTMNVVTQNFGVPLAQPPPTTIPSTIQHPTVLSTTHQPPASSPENQHSTATPVRTPNTMNVVTQNFGVPLAQPSPTTIHSTTQHPTVLSPSHQQPIGSPQTQQSAIALVQSSSTVQLTSGTERSTRLIPQHDPYPQQPNPQQFISSNFSHTIEHSNLINPYTICELY